VQLEDGHKSPIRGVVDISDGAYRYHLYRTVDESGERWLIGDDRNGPVKPLDRPTFEAAMVHLLK